MLGRWLSLGYIIGGECLGIEVDRGKWMVLEFSTLYFQVRRMAARVGGVDTWRRDSLLLLDTSTRGLWWPIIHLCWELFTPGL